MKISHLLATLSLTGLLCQAAQAQDSGTLKKIRESGVISLGVRDSSVPFSFLDGNQVYQGFSLDLCSRIVVAVQKELGLAKLEVKLNPVTSATRIPLIANGTVDLECGSTTNNTERQKQVAFAPTMFLTATRLLAKKSSHIETFADLKGKTLVSTSGTTNIKELIELNAAKNLGINIIPAKDHAEAFLMVETGRAAAFGMDDILLAALAANAKVPGDYAITKDALTPQPYAILMRRDDAAFKKVVDAAIGALYASGDIKRLYSKWFQSPIAPKGINLNWPMSEQLKHAYARPTDSGDPAAYQ